MTCLETHVSLMKLKTIANVPKLMQNIHKLNVTSRKGNPFGNMFKVFCNNMVGMCCFASWLPFGNLTLSSLHITRCYNHGDSTLKRFL
jgi:hypothetical protein